MHSRIRELLEYLEATRSALGAVVESVSPARRDERPAPDRWSVAEVLDHLNLIEKGISRVISRRLAAAKGANLGPETDASSVLDSLDRDRIADRSQRVTAPEMVSPHSGCDAASAWSALQQSRAELCAAVLAGDGLALGEVVHPHPVLGPINLYQWLVFVGSHEARHTAQIGEIADAFTSPSSAVFNQKGDDAMSNKTLYERLGGYDAVSAVASDLLPRLQADSQLARFWQHRGADGVQREKQLLIDFLCASAGGPLYYRGRDMKISHQGMKISEGDWSAFLGHLNATLDAFQVPQAERDEVVGFVQSTKPDIVEA